MPELGIVLVLLAAAGAYAIAVQRQPAKRPEVRPARATAFLTGIVVVALALVSPIDGAAHRRLWVHMVQHVLLISVAAPLLAVGRPFALAAWAWPGSLPRVRLPGRWTVVTAAAMAQVVTLLVWHVPALYDAALAHDPVHGAEHVTLLVTAVLLWAALDAIEGEQGGLGLVVVFVVSFPPLMLGAAMTFATTTWYPAYAAGADALVDQQLAGVVMWAYGGLAVVAGGIYLFVAWMRDLEQAAPGRPAAALRADVPLGGPRC
jgi:putative membrane protein